MERIEVPDETEKTVTEVSAETGQRPTDVVADSVQQAIEKRSLDGPRKPDEGAKPESSEPA